MLGRWRAHNAAGRRTGEGPVIQLRACRTRGDEYYPEQGQRPKSIPHVFLPAAAKTISQDKDGLKAVSVATPAIKNDFHAFISYAVH